MKRNVTKILSVMLVLVMAMSLMACGSKKEDKKSNKNLASLTAEELMNKVSDASKNVEGMSEKIKLDVAVSLSGMEMSLNGTVDAKTNVEPMNTYAKVDLTMNAMGTEQAVKSETYMVENDDKIDMYTLTDDEWSHESMDSSEYKDSISEAVSKLESIDYSDITKYFEESKAEVKDGKYQLILSTSTEDLIKKLEESEYADKLGDYDLSSIPEAKVTFNINYNAKTYLPESASIDLDMDTISYEGVEIELSKFVFEIEFTSYDAVKIDIPDEALAAE